MARRPRLEVPGVPLHVIQRGNNRAACFLTDGDRRLYLKCLGNAAARYRCALHAYVLMPNHVHLLVSPDRPGGVALMMQDVGRRYVRIFNDVYKRTGTLWEGRYKAAMIDSERYLLVCQRYIELNPVRAGLVSAPADYRWTSYRHHAHGITDALVTAHELVERLGLDDDARREAYRDLFRDPMEHAVIERIREATNRGWPLGGEDFLSRVEAKLGRSVRPPKRGRPDGGQDLASVSARPEMLI
ncbi:MAG TPA: transposase [Burkholderiales bacterium]|nr:transposase [Burkholderiales bacterium]